MNSTFVTTKYASTRLALAGWAKKHPHGFVNIARPFPYSRALSPSLSCLGSLRSKADGVPS